MQDVGPIVCLIYVQLYYFNFSMEVFIPAMWICLASNCPTFACLVCFMSEYVNRYKRRYHFIVHTYTCIHIHAIKQVIRIPSYNMLQGRVSCLVVCFMSAYFDRYQRFC